ncbi:hypothetical protein DLAC_07568 [Tieghemostelium lacteum]|uniref:Uncharacterized protein n=1 Tax=Tieghemostelium lacteum TaxID=361077 RepID=A0A151ZD19_TIELA|nr:hypothetical protein DLAC_07568 [Tieghemostelium lacteum]|eukprot:KYQ91774.1 hypothetical protein DLAC_07568 [Tieghemostelium lacteum]
MGVKGSKIDPTKTRNSNDSNDSNSTIVSHSLVWPHSLIRYILSYIFQQSNNNAYNYTKRFYESYRVAMDIKSLYHVSKEFKLFFPPIELVVTSVELLKYAYTFTVKWSIDLKLTVDYHYIKDYKEFKIIKKMKFHNISMRCNVMKPIGLTLQRHLHKQSKLLLSADQIENLTVNYHLKYKKRSVKQADAINAIPNSYSGIPIGNLKELKLGIEAVNQPRFSLNVFFGDDVPPQLTSLSMSSNMIVTYCIDTKTVDTIYKLLTIKKIQFDRISIHENDLFRLVSLPTLLNFTITISKILQSDKHEDPMELNENQMVPMELNENQMVKKLFECVNSSSKIKRLTVKKLVNSDIKYEDLCTFLNANITLKSLVVENSMKFDNETHYINNNTLKLLVIDSLGKYKSNEIWNGGKGSDVLKICLISHLVPIVRKDYYMDIINQFSRVTRISLPEISHKTISNLIIPLISSPTSVIQNISFSLKSFTLNEKVSLGTWNTLLDSYISNRSLQTFKITNTTIPLEIITGFMSFSHPTSFHLSFPFCEPKFAIPREQVFKQVFSALQSNSTIRILNLRGFMYFGNLDKFDYLCELLQLPIELHHLDFSNNRCTNIDKPKNPKSPLMKKFETLLIQHPSLQSIGFQSTGLDYDCIYINVYKHFKTPFFNPPNIIKFKTK